ncbi:MAG: hypothetical protein FJX99_06555, partial [Bacteroidetes bacterium]|nr:hypothetical protein [Bacteroidota bacterium]
MIQNNLIMYKKIFFIPVTLFFLFSCGSEENSEKANTGSAITSKVSNFISSRENIIAFGHINMFQILGKSDYKKNSLVNAVIDPFITKMAALNQDSPIYFAVEVNEQNINDINPYD